MALPGELLPANNQSASDFVNIIRNVATYTDLKQHGVDLKKRARNMLRKMIDDPKYLIRDSEQLISLFADKLYDISNEASHDVGFVGMSYASLLYMMEPWCGCREPSIRVKLQAAVYRQKFCINESAKVSPESVLKHFSEILTRIESGNFGMSVYDFLSKFTEFLKVHNYQNGTLDEYVAGMEYEMRNNNRLGKRIAYNALLVRLCCLFRAFNSNTGNKTSLDSRAVSSTNQNNSIVKLKVFLGEFKEFIENVECERVGFKTLISVIQRRMDMCDIEAFLNKEKYLSIAVISSNADNMYISYEIKPEVLYIMSLGDFMNRVADFFASQSNEKKKLDELKIKIRNNENFEKMIDIKTILFRLKSLFRFLNHISLEFTNELLRNHSSNIELKVLLKSYKDFVGTLKFNFREFEQLLLDVQTKIDECDLEEFQNKPKYVPLDLSLRVLIEEYDNVFRWKSCWNR